MLENLTERMSNIVRNLSGRGRLTEENIQESLRDVRMALLEADVALPVVKQFVEEVRTKAIGQEVIANIRPGDAFIKVVEDELIQILGESNSELNFKVEPPAIILMAGLQGSGKTTTTAKLAHWLKHQQKKKVLVTSTDIYRPAAIKQLATLTEQIDVEYHPSDASQKPANITKDAIAAAKKMMADVVIIDTAGRLHIDEAMMNEIKQLHQIAKPIETLFVVDSMTGQDAANTAKTFNEALALTGVILTKADGDARGGAALSIRTITGKPIKFIGVGEKIDALEAFFPDRFASRILGMGDVLSLVDQAKQKIDEKKAKKLAKKITKGKGFTLEDFLEQLEQMRSMGGIAGLLDKLPGAAQLPKAAKSAINDKMFIKMEAMIHSMTPKERQFPGIIKGSRKRRITQGSGTKVPDLNKLLKQYLQMQKMMKKLKGKGMMNMMGRFKNLMPPGGGGGNLPF